MHEKWKCKIEIIESTPVTVPMRSKNGKAYKVSLEVVCKASRVERKESYGFLHTSSCERSSIPFETVGTPAKAMQKTRIRTGRGQISDGRQLSGIEQDCLALELTPPSKISETPAIVARIVDWRIQGEGCALDKAEVPLLVARKMHRSERGGRCIFCFRPKSMWL